MPLRPTLFFSLGVGSKKPKPFLGEGLFILGVGYFTHRPQIKTKDFINN